MEETVVSFDQQTYSPNFNGGKKKSNSKKATAIIIVCILFVVLAITSVFGYVFRSDIMRAVLGETKYYFLQEYKTFSSLNFSAIESLKVANPKLSAKTDVSFRAYFPNAKTVDEKIYDASLKSMSEKTKIQLNIDNDSEAKKSKIVVDLINNKSLLKLRYDVVENAMGVSYPDLLQGQNVINKENPISTDVKSLTGFTTAELAEIVKDLVERTVINNITKDMISTESVVVEEQNLEKVTFNLDGVTLTKIYKAILAEASGDTKLNTIIKSLATQVENAQISTNKLIANPANPNGQENKTEKITAESIMKNISDKYNEIKDKENAFPELDGAASYSVYYNLIDSYIFNRDLKYKTTNGEDHNVNTININSDDIGFWFNVSEISTNAENVLSDNSFLFEVYKTEKGNYYANINFGTKENAESTFYLDLTLNDMSVSKVGNTSVLMANGSFELYSPSENEEELINFTSEFSLYPDEAKSTYNMYINATTSYNSKIDVTAITTFADTPNVSDVKVEEKSTLNFEDEQTKKKLGEAMFNIMASYGGELMGFISA